MPKQYTIIMNGGEPLVVHDIKGKAVIYQMKTHPVTYGKAIIEDPYLDEDGSPIYEEYKTIAYKKIYPGKDPKNFTKQHGEEWEKHYVGNAVLLELSDNTYMFIGGYLIFTFKLEDGDTFVRFDSPMGHSSVTYPFVVGKKNTYFLGDTYELVYLPNDALDPTVEPYLQMYDKALDLRKKKIHILKKLWKHPMF